MRVFLDTEFTDFSAPQLISCGLVAENGSEFYAELVDGWMQKQCSLFVINNILPRLDRLPSSTLTRDEAGSKLIDWLVSLGSSVTMISDVPVDWFLISRLLGSHANAGRVIINQQLLSWPGSAMARHFEIILSHSLSDEALRHHALVDARALRQAILQTETEFRK